MAKTGETLTGTLTFLFSNFNFYINFEECFNVPLSTFCFSSGRFSCYSTCFYSRSMSDWSSAHVRPVLIQYSHTSCIYYIICTLHIVFVYLAPFWITGFCLTTFSFIILVVSIHITLYELVYNIYISNAYFDLQTEFCFMLYIVIIA